MEAPGEVSGFWCQAFAVKITQDQAPFCLSVGCPIFLDHVYPLGGSDAESNAWPDHGANADVRLCAFAIVPAGRALEDWRADVSLGPNSLKHRVWFVAQFDDCVEGHTLMPLGAQPFNHLRKPYMLSPYMLSP
jgi:hypothetical protein